MRYLLDTNMCIYLMKHSLPQIAARLQKLRVGDAGMSAITYAELCDGLQENPASAPRNRAVLESLIEDLPVVPFAAAEAESYGHMRLQSSSQRRQALDRLIAAHAMSLNVTLVTNNAAEFRNYSGLRVENWTVA
jgi:tRNA(fMet)-specific endonuclease VapC